MRHILSSSLLLATIFALFCQAALPCRPEGPLLPRPSSLQHSPIFQAAAGKLTAVLDGAGAGTIKTTWPVQNLSFSVGLVSFSQEDASQPIWEYHHLAYGNTRGTRHIDKDSQYLIGSITKVMSAYILLKSGVDVNTRVTDILPELSNPSSQIEWNKVTLRMLATHLSGAPTNYGYSEHYYLKDVFRTYGFPPIQDTSYPPCGVIALNQGCTEAEVLQGMLESYPQAAPMDQPAYSNIAFTILSSAIERATGKNYSQALEEFVTVPLQLQNTFLSPGIDDQAVIPPGESSWGSDFGLNAPGGGLVSTLSDLSILSHAILSRTINLTDAETRQWLKPITSAGNLHTSVGMPWEIWRTKKLIPDNPHLVTVHGKSGSAQSYRSQLNLIDEYGIGLVVLTAGASEPLTDIMNAALATLVPAVDQVGRDAAKANYAKTFRAALIGKDEVELEASFQLDSDSLLFKTLVRNGSDMLSATTALWNIVMGDFTVPIGKTVRLVPQGVEESMEMDGAAVTKEAWRLLPELVLDSQSELPGRGVDSDNCLVWTLGDWVHYGSEPLDRVVFYRDGDGRIVGFEAPFLRSGILRAV